MSPWNHIVNPDVHASWAASIPIIGMAVHATPKLPVIITRLLEVVIIAAAVLIYNNSQKVAVQEVKLEYVIETQQEIRQDVKNNGILIQEFINQHKD